MKKHCVLFIIASLIIASISTSIFYYRKANNEHVNISKGSFMTVVFTDKNNYNHYISYNVNARKDNEFYICKNTGFPSGSILNDKNVLYFSQKTSDLHYHLFKYDKNSSTLTELISIPGISIDSFLVVKDKIYLRLIQNTHHNFQLGIYKLSSKKVFISDEKETDINIVDFSYDKKNNKLYTIEYSTDEFLSSHLPKVPLHSIVEYDANGKKTKVAYKMSVYLNNITISGDGSNALVSGSTLTPYPSIYKIDLTTLKKEVLLESNVSLIAKHPIFAPDGHGFYFLAMTPDTKVFISNTGESIKSRGVFYYDLSSKKIKNIFIRDDGTVRNYSIQ
jgi:hypothetical protein